MRVSSRCNPCNPCNLSKNRRASKKHEKEPEMGISDVTAWARKRLAEGADLGMPAPVQHGANTVPAPDRPAPQPPPAPAPVQVPPDAQASGPRVMAMPGAQNNDGEAPDWYALDKAYQLHHVSCPVCQAAGRGTRYGLRCGAGAALWSAYSAVQPPHFQWLQKGRRP